MRLVFFARIASTLALTLAAAIAFSPSDTPEAGQQAPDFTLTSQDGTQLGPQDFQGKWVVLYFYPKDNTPGCTIEAHNFQHDLSKYDQANAVVIGVSVDTTESHKDFCAKQGLTFKLLSDTDKKAVALYGSMRENGMALRNTFLIDPKGKIAKVWVKVDPSHHSEEVLTALTEMQHQ